MRNLLWGAMAPVVLLAACQKADTDAAAPDATAPDAATNADAVLASINAVEQGQQTAFNAHDLAGATAVYAPDAMFFDAGSPPQAGIDAIRPGFEAMIGDSGSTIDIKRSGSWVAQSGELAVTQANYTQTFTGKDGKTMTVSGVNQTVWKKQEDGSWKIASDFNGATGDPAPAAAAAPAAE